MRVLPTGVTSWWNIREATARSSGPGALIASSRMPADDPLAPPRFLQRLLAEHVRAPALLLGPQP
jgi:hypothetical protein